MSIRRPAQPVEHELGYRRVAHQLGGAQHLEVAGYGWLGNVENGLEIRDEERCDGETVDDAQPSGLGQRRQEVGQRQGGLHICGKTNTQDRRAAQVAPPDVAWAMPHRGYFR